MYKMNKKELKFILQEGEGLSIEFKESLKNIDKEMVALTNSIGGRIFVGISDNNQIKGIKTDNKLRSQIQDIANNCDPSINIDLEEFENVIIIDVKEGKNKPYKCSSGFYMRQGPNSQKMATKDIKEMIMSHGDIKFDNQSIKFNPSDFDEAAFSNYLKKADINLKTNKEDILFNLGASDGKDINNAGILFFSKNPKKYFINGYVTCVRYKGTEKVNVIDRKDFESNIVSQVEQALEFVKRNTRLEYEIKGLYRKDIPEYPIKAVREAILNAVMHRDYLEKGANVQIDIFDNRLTITNIGGLIKPLTKEKLGSLAVRRNPTIADLFHRIQMVEKIGSGIRRIKEECKKHGKIMFEIETNGYFIATFKLIEKVGEKVGENEKKIINLISQNKNITYSELASNINLSEKSIYINIEKLKQKGLLLRIGPAKGGHWVIKK